MSHKAMYMPQSLPMRGKHKPRKVIALAKRLDMPQYFQHTINSFLRLEKNDDSSNSNEEDRQVESPLVECAKEEIRKARSSGKRKPVAERGLLD